MWVIKNTRGDWVQTLEVDTTDKSARKKFNDRVSAVVFMNMVRENSPEFTFHLVRLVTKREKLKRELLRGQGEYERRANVEAKIDRNSQYHGWYRGYARALRDVAGQL